jgi:RNA polymerase sigma-70 factor (ECF subfamily)
MDERPDDVLVEEARQGKSEAFAELARRHQQRIFGLIYGMTKNRSDADDLCQEVFLTAFRSIPGFQGRSSFSTWVYRIAINASLNFLKRRGREGERAGFHDNLPEGDGGKAATSSPEMSAVRNELQDRIEDAVGSLPPLFKASFVLVAGQGLSHAEAARALGCSENTVSWRMHKARKMLQARLKPFLNEVGS